MQPAIQESSYGTLPDGAEVRVFELVNRSGLRARIMTLGATLIELQAPDRNGNLADVTLGFDDLAGWLKPDNPYMGATVGRYANRIAGGRLQINGTLHQLALNNGPCSLHGGVKGFDKKLWNATPRPGPEGPAVEFKLTSPDGDENYPGTLQVHVVYTLTHANELRIDYTARADRETVVNLTNHAYWNLAGSDDVLAHVARIAASRVTEVNPDGIPSGRLLPVDGTPFDFKSPATIGSRLSGIGNTPVGYDHNYVLDAGLVNKPAFAARVEEASSGRVLEVWTTEPGVQFYTGNFLDGTLTGKGGRPYGKHAGFCLETQHFPDSPNHPHFPSTILKPGDTYRQSTVHRFTTLA